MKMEFWIVLSRIRSDIELHYNISCKEDLDIRPYHVPAPSIISMTEEIIPTYNDRSKDIRFTMLEIFGGSPVYVLECPSIIKKKIQAASNG